MADVWQVQVATPTKELAVELAKGAVEARLAAGAQVVGPATSVFWHEGEFGTSEEWIAILKSTPAAYAELERYLVDHHEWDSPEITAVPVEAGLPAYLAWVQRTTSK